MEEVSVQKNVSEQLPDIIFIPNLFRVKRKVVEKIIDIQVDAGHAEHLLDQKDRSRRDHQILNGRRQALAKRETIAVIGHTELLRTQLSNVTVQMANEIRVPNLPLVFHPCLCPVIDLVGKKSKVVTLLSYPILLFLQNEFDISSFCIEEPSH